jgi:hypothetical protein
MFRKIKFIDPGLDGWRSGRLLMTRLGGMAKTFSFLFFLSVPLSAQDHISNNSAKFFSVFVPLAANPSQEQPGIPAAEAQPPKVLSRTSPVRYAPMSGRDKWNYYLKITYGPTPIGFSIFGAGLKQARPSVPEWGGGMEGYAKRFGSSFGQRVINRSIRLGLNGLLREDPRYIPSDRSGALHRTLHAVRQTLVAHKDSGGTRIAFSRFAGDFGSACISRQWHPDSYRTARNCVVSGFTSLGIDTMRNVFDEFFPDIRKIFRH